jgi:uncharacterized protein with GYD domain
MPIHGRSAPAELRRSLAIVEASELLWPEGRSEAIAEMLAAAGGRLIGWYLTLGRYDWLIVAEAPDERTLVAAVLPRQLAEACQT